MSTLLLIEDDPWLAELYTDVFTAAQFRVIRAGDAQQAIELLSTHQVEAIILDLLLPGFNGIALLHELRSYPALGAIPVVIHSAVDPKLSGLPPEAWQAYGVSAFVPKGLARPQELVRTVKRVVYEAV